MEPLLIESISVALMLAGIVLAMSYSHKCRLETEKERNIILKKTIDMLNESCENCSTKATDLFSISDMSALKASSYSTIMIAFDSMTKSVDNLLFLLESKAKK